MVIARYHGQVVFCRDVAASADRYERSLGFWREDGSDGDIAMRAHIAGGDGSVEIYLHPSAEALPCHLGTFIVDDADETVAQLIDQDWQLTGSPTDQPWGVREATVVDPEGHSLTLNALL